jgi:alkylresorcinol/alkylpyrone synthase
MSSIVGVTTAAPSHRVTQHEVRDFICSLFAGSDLPVDRLVPVFENSGIGCRQFSAPLEWYSESHTFAERNRIYVETALDLSEQAVADVCSATGIAPSRVDHIFFVSSTGLSTPSLDAYLLNRVDFQESIRRTPIWGLGCAGGVGGLSRAHDWLKGHPEGCALVVAVELCTLTFLKDDLSKRNFVATALFGDGCGAAILVGDAFEGASKRSLHIDATHAVTWRDSLDVMGWNLQEEGLKVVFSKSIPDIVRRRARSSIEAFLDGFSLSINDMDAFLAHPGGMKVIAAYQEALGLSENALMHTRAVLQSNGNMSSATVFFVLKRYLEASSYRPGERVLSCALGPGFSSEMFLARSA